MTNTHSTFPLGQLVDLMDGWLIEAFFWCGFAAPLCGFCCSLMQRSTTRWKPIAVIIFYSLALSSGGITLFAQTSIPAAACTFMILMPLGLLLGLLLLLPKADDPRQRGFEVENRVERKIEQD